MKLLITHIRPHMDDICGIWLYRKFAHGWGKSGVRFIPADPLGSKRYKGIPVDRDPNTVYVGIGRGSFDEHKGDIGKSAAVLVWEYFKKNKLLPKNQIKTKALRRVLDFVLAEDLGARIGQECWKYEIGTVIMWISDSEERVRVGSVLLDALWSFFIDYETLGLSWKRRKNFKTPWGRGVGIVSDIPATIRAYDEGYVVAAQVDPKRGYRSVRAHANSSANLASAYKKVKKLEPNADWYLHHSKKLLICGSEVAPQAKKSKLGLDQLIAIVQKL